jgi:predicted ribosomally synthesized peptide with SipW-like signal peptide
VAIAIAVAVLVASAPGSSYAYWRATATAPPVSVSAGTVVAPATTRCATNSGIVTSSAQVSWAAVTGAVEYRVTISNATGTSSAYTQVKDTSLTITQGLLRDLLSGLLTTLLGGNPLYVTVQTVHPSGWVSPASSPRQAIAQTLVPVGVRCV